MTNAATTGTDKATSVHPNLDWSGYVVLGIWAAATLAVPIVIFSLGISMDAPLSCARYDAIVKPWVPAVSSVLVFATIIGSLMGLARGSLPPPTRALLLGFWLVTPPVWFSFEYFWLYRPIYLSEASQLRSLTAPRPSEGPTISAQAAPERVSNLARPEVNVCGVSWEQFKYAQDVSSKIWAGLVAFLAVLYFKEVGGTKQVGDSGANRA